MSQLFSWNLTQERIDLLAALLHRAELVFDTASPGCIAAERAASLLTDLREQCCIGAGAQDPCPDRPLFPRFDSRRIAGELAGQERAA